MVMKALLLLLISLPALAQYGGYTRQTNSKSAVVIMTATLSSNLSSTGLVAAPSRKQLGNWGISCSGGVIQPNSIGLRSQQEQQWGGGMMRSNLRSTPPVGQLYATTAIKTAAEAAGCAVQSVVVATASGTGIAAPDNGQNAGGTDSATAITDTYGGTGDDSVCTGDPHRNDPTLIAGLAAPGCTASSSAAFAETTAAGFGNSDVLFPSLYATNSTTLDQACCYLRSIYFWVGALSTLWDWEMDININSSPTAYGASSGGYFGWGTHWGKGLTMFAYCPQDCSAWKAFKGKEIHGGADLTTYPLTSNHYYHLLQYGHRNPGCTFASGSNCFFYDHMTIYDVTAGTAPATYYLVDSATGNPAGGIPVDHHTWTAGLVPQVQIDMTTAAASTNVSVQSDTVIVYKLQ